MLFSATVYADFHVSDVSCSVSVSSLPWATVCNPCSSVCITARSFQCVKSALQTIVCGPAATLNQTADTNPNCLAQAQMFGFSHRVFPSGRLTGIFIVFSVLPYANHSGMQISRMGKNKRRMKKIHYFHNFFPSHVIYQVTSTYYEKCV